MSWINVAIAAVGVVTSVVGAKKGADAAKGAGKKEAAVEREVTEERVRQIGKHEEILRGQTISRTAASGVKTDVGSPLEVLAEQQAEFERERSFTERVGASKAGLASQRANTLASQYKFAGVSSAIQGIGQMFSIYDQNKSSSTSTGTRASPFWGPGG